jgi:hypothetical protein
MKLSDHVL